MADKPVTEVVAVDAALDALSSPTSSDVYEAVDAFNEKAVAAAAAARALAGGGSQPFTVVRFPFAFNTPGITAGVTIYTPAVGDVIVGLPAFSVPAVWDGSSPVAPVYLDGSDPDAVRLGAADLGVANALNAGIGMTELATYFDFGHAILATATTPIKVIITDGSGGAPGSTHGTGEVILIVIPAA